MASLFLRGFPGLIETVKNDVQICCAAVPYGVMWHGCKDKTLRRKAKKSLNYAF